MGKVGSSSGAHHETESQQIAERQATREGSVSLQYPMLTRSNYAAWAIKVRVYMEAQGVWDAVEPAAGVVVEPRKDKMALAAIYQGIPEDALLAIAEKRTAREAWNTLAVMHVGTERVKSAQVQTLKTEFELLRMKESESLDDFAMKLSALVNRIRTLGETMEEEIVVKKFLRGVSRKFGQIVSTVEQFGDITTMPLVEAIGRLKAHEERVRVSEGDGEHLLLTHAEWSARTKKGGTDSPSSSRGQSSGGEFRGQGARGKGRGRGRGRKGRGGRGSNTSQHQEDGDRENGGGGRDKSKIKCYRCGVFGHYASECRGKKHDEEVNLMCAQDEEPALMMAMIQEEGQDFVMLNAENVVPSMYSEDEARNIWYLDNGASNHMTGDREKFRELDEKITGNIKFGDGSTVRIHGKGDIIIECKNGEQRVLQGVYYIPSLTGNIISIGQLTEAGNNVFLVGDFLKVYDRCGTLIMKVRRSSNRLYKTPILVCKPECFLSKMDDPAWLWHARLGHVNFPALGMMAQKELAVGVPRIVRPNRICEGCVVAKQARLPFPTQAKYRAAGVLELIHMDLCGPISPETMSGSRYFLLLVDDASRYMWVYTLRSKDEAFESFKKFKALVENETNRKIQTLRSDRGGEFMSKMFRSLCDKEGIQSHFTAPYSPQQNGVVERRNRTVLDMARSLLKSMNVPGRMWGEAVRHAVYLLNRLPTKALGATTPYQVWKGMKPNLLHLKVFGCTAHAKVVGSHLKKLEDRSVKMVYFGVEPGSKAHRLFDPRRERIQVSRDVVFDEEKPWDWNQEEGCTLKYSPEFTVNEEFSVPATSKSSFMEQVVEPENSILVSPSPSMSPETPTSALKKSVLVSPGDLSSTSSDGRLRKHRLLDDVYEASKETTLEMDELFLIGTEEPTCFAEAAGESEWREAMIKEMECIEKNQTWELVDPPKGKKVIGLKWVFKLKKDTDGKILKHKARLVAKGYVQKQGVDFNEVFAPVARLDTVRLLIALSAQNGWELHHLDVKSAFLNGELREEVFVKQPEGFVVKNQEHKVYRLMKALYGLRQAPRAWNVRLDGSLKSLGFRKCSQEQAVYTRGEGDTRMIVGVYVDDLIVTGENAKEVYNFKNQMMKEFEMSDLGLLSYYLGIEVQQGKNFISLKQSAYAKRILSRFGMAKCNSAMYPMEAKLKLDKDEKGELVDSTEYRRIVGCLRYLTHTRPDLSYAVGLVSRHMERPTTKHQQAVKHIFRYLKGTIEYGLKYVKVCGGNVLAGFSDSDLAGDVVDGRSTGGMAFYLGGNLITWQSRKQRTVALSSCEAEFMAAAVAACQALWLRDLLSEVTGKEPKSVTLFVDNKSAIALLKNPVLHDRSKHINTRYHFIRECVENEEITVEHVRSGAQRADILTKPLPKVKFIEMRESLGVKNLAEGLA